MAASSGFINVANRVAALTSVLSPSPNATPTAPSQATTSSPTDSVGSFQNQQLGGLLSKNSAVTGGPIQNTDPSRVSIAPQGMGQSAVSLMAQNTLGSVQAAQERTNNLYAIAAQKKAARAAAASQGGGGGDSGGGGGVGMAYQANGQLSDSRNKALQTAFSYVGHPYQLGGTSYNGIDCSGLVMMVYDQFGYGSYLDNHDAHMQQNIPGVKTSVSNLRPGDIVAWRDGSHIAIYAGNGMIVSAADYGEGVKYQPVWGDTFGIALRLPGE